MYSYWIWVQETSVFTQSSRAAIMELMDHMSFACALQLNGACIDPGTGVQYECIAGSIFAGGTKCMVSGREVLFITQGIGRDRSFWTSLGFLLCILVCFKISIYILTVYPWERMRYQLSVWADFTSHKSHHAALASSRLEAKESSKVSKYDSEESLALAVVPESLSNSFSGDDRIDVASSTPALTWTNISVVLPKTKAVLIDNVSGMVQCGRVLALMGPSGAGKTTILNALSRRAKYAKVTGDVKFAGRAMTPADLTYVPQFDVINSVLTIEEHFLLVGQLTCTDKTAMLARMRLLLDVLGLTQKVHTTVGELTGGEKKRVSIGLGMMSSPSVLFLDGNYGQ